MESPIEKQKSARDRFLDAFGKIEQVLRTESNSETSVSFSRLLDRAIESKCKCCRIVSRFSGELRHFANLRNLLSHRLGRTVPIAYPSSDCVERIEKLAAQFESCPCLENVIKTPVTTLQLSNRVSDALKVMVENVFDQIPIWDNERIIGLLTSSSLSKWIGEKFVKDEGIIVEDVLLSELADWISNDCFAVLRKSCTVQDVLNQFELSMDKGKPLAAIVFNSSGSKKERPELIVTPTDIPILTASIRV